MARYRGYGQLCPVAKATEVLAERWTLVIVRELLYGSRHFNELRRGIPLISPGVLSQRLRALEDAGVIERCRASGGRGACEYRLLPAGRELGPLVEQLGIWGQRWAVKDLRREDLDPAYLMWAMHRCLRPAALKRNAVIAFELFDAPANKRRWWIVVRDDQVELCVRNLGYEVDLTVSARVRTLAEVWLGRLSPGAALRSRAILLSGAAALVRTFAEWCPRSPLATR